MEQRDLVVVSDLANLPLVLEFVRNCCVDAGLSDDAVFACELATDEAVTNVIEHAYLGRRDGSIAVTCYRQGDRFVVRVHDHGASFDPSQVAGPVLTGDLADRDVGGLGLHFMRSLMDEVRFEFDEQQGNTLTMVKRLS